MWVWNGLRTVVRCCLDLWASLFLNQVRIQLAGGHRFRVSFSQRLRAYLQGVLSKREGLVQMTLLLSQESQVMQRFRCLRMLGAKPLFSDGKRTSRERFGFQVSRHICLALDTGLPDH